MSFKQSVFFLLALFLYSASFAQSIDGTWKGTLDVQGTHIPIVFHIAKDKTEKLVATFDSPSQNAYNLQCSDVITKEDSVILMMAILNGKYAGVLSQDKKAIAGSWFQGGGSLPLTMTKTSDSAIVKVHLRPQTPKPPFAYHSEDVVYWNADKTIQYGATLTYPAPDPAKADAKAGTYPALILITGSGQQDRDENLFEHKPFAIIADYLTKKGFAVLRVDDRGMGKTTGRFDTSTSYDFAKDVEAGLDFLERQPQVNKGKIGLLGHSEGGMIAPIVAGERKEVKFMVLLAAPGIPIADLMQQQSEAVGISEGKTVKEAKAAGYMLRIIWDELSKKEDTATTINKIRSKISDLAKTFDSTTLAKIRADRTISVDDEIRQAIARLSTKWYKYFLPFNPQPYLEKLNCKVLALNGSKDVQVVASSNLAGLRSSLQKSRSPKYDVMEMPGLNHLFQTCIKCSPSEYNDLEESFSPKTLDTIGDWLVKNVQ